MMRIVNEIWPIQTHHHKALQACLIIFLNYIGVGKCLPEAHHEEILGFLKKNGPGVPGSQCRPERGRGMPEWGTTLSGP